MNLPKALYSRRASKVEAEVICGMLIQENLFFVYDGSEIQGGGEVGVKPEDTHTLDRIMRTLAGPRF